MSQQADDVLNIIQYRTARRDVCDLVRLGNLGGAITRGELACKLHELHILSLKPAVLALEPKSASEIGQMKSWAMSNLARPGQMAQCDECYCLCTNVPSESPPKRQVHLVHICPLHTRTLF
jgi:hypothetical protein